MVAALVIHVITWITLLIYRPRRMEGRVGLKFMVADATFEYVIEYSSEYSRFQL